MKYLALLLGLSVSAFGQSFNATSYNYRNGDIQYITGTIEQPDNHDKEFAEFVERSAQWGRAFRAQVDAEIRASRAEQLMREQNELLRKIAEKK